MLRAASVAAFGITLYGLAAIAVPRQPAGRPAGDRDWPRFGFDAAVSNASTVPTGIDPGNVASLARRQVSLDGTVDSSPIYLRGVQVGGAAHDVLFMTTTYGKTIALDARDGRVLWEHTPQGFASWSGSYRITTATPAADPDRAFIYAAAPDGRVRKLAVADGREVWSTAITTLPEREKIASALNVFKGRVLATTGGYIGDRAPYQGHVAVLDSASGRLLHAWNSLCADRTGLLDPRSCSASGSAIWGRGGAIVDTASGNIFVATGNGKWDGRTNWGDSVLELAPDATRLVGNYTPKDTAKLDAEDLDLGSASPALLGTDFIAQGGKGGSIYLLRRDQVRGAAPHRGGEAQSVRTPSGGDLFATIAVMRGKDGIRLFAADSGGTAAWVLRDGGLQPAWRNGQSGTSPVIAGGLLYVYDPKGNLRVYDPEGGRQVASFPCGTGHWNSPIVVEGMVVLPEGNANAHRITGILNIWRLRGRTPARP